MRRSNLSARFAVRLEFRFSSQCSPMTGTRSTLVARRRPLWAKLAATQECRRCRVLFTLTIRTFQKLRERHCVACTLRSNEKALKLSLQRSFILTKGNGCLRLRLFSSSLTLLGSLTLFRRLRNRNSNASGSASQRLRIAVLRDHILNQRTARLLKEGQLAV